MNLNREPLRADPNVRSLRWQTEPGDLLVVHPWALQKAVIERAGVLPR